MSRLRLPKKRICARFLRLVLALGVIAPALAGRAGAAPYTYQLMFYAGEQGVFQRTDQVAVIDSATNRKKVENVDYQTRMEGANLVVSGLKRNDMVSVQYENAVRVTGARYYLKGIRQSGWDNNTVGAPSFQVTGDADYVMAYGMRGTPVKYTVNYVSVDGTTLAPSRTYYGNAGDKPVIAFLYIEGYEPQAYNLTQTLSDNEAKNVFTFTYRPLVRVLPPDCEAQDALAGPAGAGNTAASPAGEAGSANAGNRAAASPAGEAALANAENKAAGEAGAASEADAGGATRPTDGEGLQQLEETQAPQGLVDLDDTDAGQVPLADLSELPIAPEQERQKCRRYPQIAGAAAVLLLLAAVIFWQRRKKRK